jgi:hypothetical protein
MLDAIRFGSVMPACGERVVVGGGPQVEDWNTATGTSNGRPLLMFLTGAVDKDETLEGTFTPPLRNPVQPRFGGGVMDGYVVLLDLSPGEPKVRKQEEIPTAEKRIIESEPPLLPAENQVWSLGGESYFNVQLTLREKPETGLWPRFYHGRADEGGKFIYTTAEDGETDATFMLRAHHLEQGDGDQSRRLFGTQLSYKRVPDGKDRKGRPQTRYVPTPRIEFELTGMSPWRLEEQRHERNDSIRVSQQPVCTVQGALLVDGRRVEIPEARCTGYFSFPRKVVETPDIKPNKAMLRIYFTVTGHDLGITGDQEFELD